MPTQLSFYKVGFIWKQGVGGGGNSSLLSGSVCSITIGDDKSCGNVGGGFIGIHFNIKNWYL